MEEKIAVVTGATGGMGTKIVADLARDHHVFAVARTAGAHFADAPNITPVDLDLVAALDGGFPAFPARVDVVVHAAAAAQKFSVAQAEPSDWRYFMDLNVHAPAVLTSHLLPAVRKAGGTVVFINSGAGRHSYADNAVYAATKHALYAVADSLRLAESDIRVATVAPGPTDTAMLAGLRDYDPKDVIDPVEVARAIRAVVDAGPSTQITNIDVRPRKEL